MAGSKKFLANAKDVTTTNKDQSVVSVVENQLVKNVVVVPFTNIKMLGQSVEAVT